MYRKIFISLLLTLFLIPLYAEANCSTHVLMPNLPTGLTFAQEKIAIQPGYYFLKKNSKELLVVSKKTGEATATLFCYCFFRDGKCGGPAIRGEKPFCFSNTCKDCVLSVIQR